MDYVNYFRHLIESLTDYSKIVLIMISVKNELDLLIECGFLKNDVNRLCIDFKKTLIDQKEDILD